MNLLKLSVSDYINFLRDISLDNIANRIYLLYKCEVPSGEKPIEKLSLAFFVHFISSIHDEIIEPSITLTTEGLVKTIWHKSESEDEMIWVEFNNDGTTTYIVFNNEEKYVGVATIFEIYNIIYETEWIRKETL
ncbi:MAG: hypothetical protein ACOC56_00350 [Atribacterota bacterium]